MLVLVLVIGYLGDGDGGRMQLSTYCVALALQSSCRFSEGWLVLMLSLRDCGFVIDIGIGVGDYHCHGRTGSIDIATHRMKSNTKQQTKTMPFYLG